MAADSFAFDTKVEGFAALEKALQELPKRVQGNIMRAALGAGAGVIREEARRLAPVDTGALKRSIRVSRSRDRQTGMPMAFVKAGGKAVRVGPRGDKRKVVPYYAVMVEFGTKKHLIKARRKKALKFGKDGYAGEVEHPGVRERPFMRPAFDRRWQAAVEKTAEQIRRRLAAEAAKK